MYETNTTAKESFEEACRELNEKITKAASEIEDFEYNVLVYYSGHGEEILENNGTTEPDKQPGVWVPRRSASEIGFKNECLQDREISKILDTIAVNSDQEERNINLT